MSREPFLSVFVSALESTLSSNNTQIGELELYLAPKNSEFSSAVKNFE